MNATHRLDAVLCQAFCALLLLAAASVAAAQTERAAAVDDDANANPSTFTLFFENDLFADTDRRYTSGVKLSWVSPDLSEYRDSRRLPAWSHGLIDLLPFIHAEGVQRNVAVSLGQSIYTPSDIDTRALEVEDRPYAGWLYGSAAFHNRTETWLDVIEVQVGVVGPLALAEETQNLVHDLRGIPEARGWDNQLENELGVNIIWERKWRALQLGRHQGLGADLLAHAGGSVGNVSTYANAGGEARLGWNLPADFGTSLIRASGVTDAPVRGRPREAGVHLFVSVDGRAVARDIFLDGNTFRSSHDVDKKYLVADVAAGVSFTLGRMKLSLTRALRTREFRGQDDHQRFGSIALSYTY